MVNKVFEDLREAFETLNGADMMLNPKKSFFDLTGGKFLGFMVSMRGIEIHPSKSQAILDMKAPKNLKELQTLTGRLAALNRFITRSGRMLAWALELSKFDITFHPQNLLKSQIFTDFIAKYSGTPVELGGRWKVYVNGASSLQGAGAGVSLLRPQGEMLNYTLHFQFPITNNTAEYEALIVGLRLAKEVGARKVHLHSDSELAVRQLNEECRTIDENLRKYYDHFQTLKGQFDEIKIQHVLRTQNNQVDALSKLGAARNLDKDRPVIVMDIPTSSITNSGHEILVAEIRETWMTPMLSFLTSGTLPEDPLAARRMKKIAPLYSIFNNYLYKRGYVRPWLKCIPEDDAKRILLDIHEGFCGSHQGAKTLAKRAIRAGFYWPTMQQDAVNLQHPSIQPDLYLGGMAFSDLWGIDIVGPFPKATLNKRCIIVAVEYFTKWVETEALSEIMAVVAKNFILRNIICRFGIPYAIISDNGTYGLKKKVAANWKNWPDMLDQVLWIYCTTPREATQQSPYSLIYGMESVTPIELVQLSLQVTSYTSHDNEDARATDLEFVTEAREQARVRTEEYQKRIKRAFDRKAPNT
ncbi:uncharacterized protein LOC144554452 [Carex rostrata]